MHNINVLNSAYNRGSLVISLVSVASAVSGDGSSIGGDGCDWPRDGVRGQVAL